VWFWCILRERSYGVSDAQHGRRANAQRSPYHSRTASDWASAAERAPFPNFTPERAPWVVIVWFTLVPVCVYHGIGGLNGAVSLHHRLRNEETCEKKSFAMSLGSKGSLDVDDASHRASYLPATSIPSLTGADRSLEAREGKKSWKVKKHYLCAPFMSSWSLRILANMGN
jgi:hypothetical protein